MYGWLIQFEKDIVPILQVDRYQPEVLLCKVIQYKCYRGCISALRCLLSQRMTSEGNLSATLASLALQKAWHDACHTDHLWRQTAK